MRRDPFGRLPTPLRLWAAAGLCAVPLGLLWSISGSLFLPGTTIYGDCGYSDGPYCTPDTYLPGTVTPGHHQLVSQSPAGPFLVAGCLALVWVASRRRTLQTRRITRLTCAGMGTAALLAAAHGATITLLCTLAALALVAPLVWPRRRPTGFFVPTALRR